MLKIGICTKQTKFAIYVKNLLGSILAKYDNWSIEVVDLKSFLAQRAVAFLDYHIFCVDEQFIRTSEIELVEYLRCVRPEASILLLEGRTEKGIDGIRYHLFAYRVDRLQQQVLEMELDRLWQYANTASHMLSIEKGGESILVPIQNIVYIESSNHRIILHTTSEDYEYYEKMYVLEKLLENDDFIRCHKGYLVSRQYVTNYSNTEIELGQITLPVGRKYQEQLQQVFGVKSDESKSSEKMGSITGVSGNCKGISLHMHPEHKILVGRDDKIADLVLCQPKVSRMHCIIIYHDKENLYEVVDFSKNGTYVANPDSGMQRLVSDTSYCVKVGTQISFGDTDNVYYLG